MRKSMDISSHSIQRYCVSTASFACGLMLCMSAYADGDIADDMTFDSNVRTDVLKPNEYYAAELEYLQDIGRLFSPRLVTGEITENDLPDIFAFASKYPGWPYAIALLATAVDMKSMRDRAIAFTEDLAEKYPQEGRLQLTMAEILIKYGRLQEAYPYLERSYKLAMKNPDAAPEEMRIFNTASVSKFLLLVADLYDRDPDNATLRKQLHDLRAELASVKSFQSDPKVMEVLLLSCSQELKGMKKLPVLPSFILPPVNERAALEQELDALAQIVLHSILPRPEKTSIENPNFPNTFRMLHELGRDTEIMQAALIRLAEDPNDTEAMLIVSLLTADEEDFPVSASAWDMIFARLQHPSDSMLGTYAKALRDAERYEESSRFYRLLGDRTNHADMMGIEVAINLFEQGRAKDVLAILRDGYDCFERSILLSDCYRITGDKEAAFKSMLQAQQQDPDRGNTTSFRLQVAFLAEEVGDMEVAESQLLPLIQGGTENPEVYNSLGYLYAVRDYKLDDAEKYLQTALRMSPSNFAILDSYAWLLYKQKKYDQARESIDQAITLMGNAGRNEDAVLFLHAGDIYHALGDKDRATKFWQRAAELPSDELDYDGVEWRLRGGTPAQWENYVNMKNPIRTHRQNRNFKENPSR